ncbi:hypothetical protein [Halococcus saccharolyticus]|uniref:Glycosyltransferase RgtA/B/C/D-like domain-containing protein n=1 Tax=Halococcus saccharolyticus DSM 5350 TaxID=1227455 RepID=M0MPB1_9EURY|nr:hypothetical protein [Halococcus saccharolyticus]EMA47208.1 hypothetical protein C449_02050 [Halococcus saccharolyticus DSM 5350]
MAGGTDSGAHPGLFSLREIIVAGWVTVASLIFFNVFVRFFYRTILDNDVGVPIHWPISKFAVRLGRLEASRVAVLVVLAIVVFTVATVYLRWFDRTSLWPVVVAGTVLLVLTTLTQGHQAGLIRPIANGGSYYRAAVTITDPVAFVETFEANQLGLPLHARTHPPGAVLSFWILDTLLPSTRAVSLAVGIGSLALSALLLHRLLATYYPRDVAQYTTYLFVLLPAVQIYYLTTLDALITVAALGAIYCFTRDSQVIATFGTLACLFVAASQTFMTVFLGPVLVGLALLRRDRIAPLVVIGLSSLGIYALVNVVFGYDYIASFLTASHQQNPNGFFPLAEPLRYLTTRVENVAEIALFFTPVLAVLAVRGVGVLWRSARGLSRIDSEPLVIFGIATGSLLGLFAVGVYHTGETARGAMFIYPFLMLPVAAALRAADPTRRREALLAAAVFGQALLMQIVGDYLW